MVRRRLVEAEFFFFRERERNDRVADWNANRAEVISVYTVASLQRCPQIRSFPSPAGFSRVANNALSVERKERRGKKKISLSKRRPLSLTETPLISYVWCRDFRWIFSTRRILTKIRIENRREGIKKERRRFEQFLCALAILNCRLLPLFRRIFSSTGEISAKVRVHGILIPPSPDVWNFNISSERKSWGFRGLIIALISHSWSVGRFSITRIFIRECYAKLRIGNIRFFTSSCKILDVSWRDRPRGGGVSNPSAVIDDVSRERKISPFRKV